jgi:hypothetical protein
MRSLSNATVAIAHYILLVFAPQVGAAVFEATFRLLACVVLAFLLLFVIKRSQHLVQLVVAWIGHVLGFASSFLLPQDWQRLCKILRLPPTEPSLSPDFQRPPPLF